VRAVSVLKGPHLLEVLAEVERDGNDGGPLVGSSKGNNVLALSGRTSQLQGRAEELELPLEDGCQLCAKPFLKSVCGQ
jgi:hypothetical protein